MGSWEGGLKGAGTGAAIGSAFGPAGALAGAGIGGVAGYFMGGEDPNDALRKQFDPNRNAGDMSTLQNLLMQRAQGTGPSVADMQRASASRQLMAQQQSMAASARPGQSGLATRLMMQNQATGNARLGEQAQIARLQEQQMNQGQLAQYLLGQRQQDISGALGMAGQQTGMEKAMGVAGPVAMYLGKKYG